MDDIKYESIAARFDEQTIKPRSKPILLEAYRGTDDANADLFLEHHGQDVRFCPPWDKWLLWTGSHWRIDDRLDIDRLAADIPRMLYRRASDTADTGERRAIADLARKLERNALRSAMLIAARHRVVVHHTDLDKGDMLLNAANGTIDLSTGQLRPHIRSDLLTHDTEVEYRSNHAAPTWIRFLNEIFSGDQNLIDFVQRAVGYSLTGSVREQVLFIPFGAGANGKSTFLNVLKRLSGSLALQAAPDLLLMDRHRRHPAEQAELFGKRLVVCQETGEGRRFNEPLVKQLTGGDSVTARRMYENFWTFLPTWKLWLSTNHKPEIRGTDYAIWRRIRLIPFDQTFTDESTPRKDPGIEAKLMEELPGILAWAVAGCLDWKKHGLGVADAVKTATANYQSEMDMMSAWLADCCIVGKRYESKASDLYHSYVTWCEQSGESHEPQRKWGMRLTERGFIRLKNRDGWWWSGIGILVDRDPCDPSDPERAIFRADYFSRGVYADLGSHGSQGSQKPENVDSRGTQPGVGDDTKTGNPPESGMVWINDQVGWGWEGKI